VPDVLCNVSRLKLYRSVIRPIVVYGCETWVLKESIIERLSVFERKILRKIQGDSVARGSKLLFVKNYVMEIMTSKFIYTYRERLKTAWNPPQYIGLVPGMCI